MQSSNTVSSDQATPTSGGDGTEPSVVVVGGANTDYLVQGPALPTPGATIRGSEFREAPGGKGANQAVAAARLGARVALVARVGADPRGQAILQRLVEEHVDTRAVVTDPDASSGVALVMVDAAGDKQILTAAGANQRLTAADVEAASALVANARVMLLQLEAPLDAVSTAIRLARAAGARVVLDPAPPIPLPEALLKEVHVLRANSDEAEVLTGVAVEDAASAKRAAENLFHRGVSAVCVGARDGTFLLSAEGEFWFPHLPVTRVDATGAGDAFAGALAAALAENFALSEAVRFAHTAAALKLGKLGAQAGLPHRAEVLGMLHQTRAVRGIPRVTKQAKSASRA
jgi:ribokinase